MLVLQHPQGVGDLFDEAVHLFSVHPLNFLQQTEVVAEVGGNLDEGAQVLGEAGTAKAKAGIEEPGPNAGVEAHAPGHFLNIRPGRFAHHGEGVGVADLEREEGIGGVLDEFRRIGVGDDERCLERGVQFPHGGFRTRTANADHNAIGLHQVIHRKAFAEELRIANHIKLHLRLAVPANGLGDLLGGLHWHRALVDDDPIAGEVGGDFPSDRFDEAQVYGAVILRRRGHCDENHFRPFHAFRGGPGKVESAGGDIAANQVFQTGLVNGNPTRPEHFDLFGVVVDAKDLVSHLSEASAGHQAHVTRTNDCDFHEERAETGSARGCRLKNKRSGKCRGNQIGGAGRTNHD